MNQENPNPGNPESGNLTRGIFWTSAVFYVLIAFEFFYMFSPFAAYIYGIYGPGLEALNLSESTSWLISFFMPHIVRETQSPLITWHEAVGMVIFLIGLSGFIVGASHIYWNKLTQLGMASGGIYSHIRHPQYIALMTASFGMVLIWPRYLVLFGFVTVCFAYYLLARLEEQQCLRKFPDYGNYLARTGMFLPRGIERLFGRLSTPDNRYLRIAGSVALYLVCLLASFVVARGVHGYTISNLYTHASETEVCLSLGKAGPETLASLARIAKSDSTVRARLAPHIEAGHRMINYLMPAELYVSEVPMFIPEGRVPTHEWPGSKDQDRFKIIFTRAHFGPGGPSDGLSILRRAVNKTPIVEVWINRKAGQVEKVLDPPEEPFYEGMPVPVF